MPNHTSVIITIFLIYMQQIGVTRFLLWLSQKSYCTVLTEELGLRLRTSDGNKLQENVDRGKEDA